MRRPAITSTVRGLCRQARFTWEMDGHEGSAPSTPVWKTGVCLSTPIPGKWNPVLESHQHVRFCKPPPGLLGQRDNRVKLRRPTKDQNLCRADLGSPADWTIRGLNRSRSPRCNACARESRAERGSLRPTHPDRKQTPACADRWRDTEPPNEA